MEREVPSSNPKVWELRRTLRILGPCPPAAIRSARGLWLSILEALVNEEAHDHERESWRSPRR